MWTVSYIFLCCFVVVIAEAKMSLKKDRHFLIAKLGDQAELECCCGGPENMNFTWLVCTHGGKLTKCIPSPVNSTEDISINASFTNNVHCGTISFKSVTLNDTGMYLCLFSQGIHSYGTYLHVYEPLKKTVNLSENTKNKILTAQGILLFLCVLLPAFSILCQSKRLHELEKKKVQKEEENIYQGLNLDDCYAAYDQIERSQNNGPYQDVCNVLGDDIQLEKP